VSHVVEVKLPCKDPGREVRKGEKDARSQRVGNAGGL